MPMHTGHLVPAQCRKLISELHQHTKSFLDEHKIPHHTCCAQRVQCTDHVRIISCHTIKGHNMSTIGFHMQTRAHTDLQGERGNRHTANLHLDVQRRHASVLTFGLFHAHTRTHNNECEVLTTLAKLSLKIPERDAKTSTLGLPSFSRGIRSYLTTLPVACQNHAK